jgi:1-deoxy-D-xylulose-5-phosphate reductoisomerase
MAPCVLNAANEVAVAAFLAGEIPFTGIPEIVERVLDSTPAPAPTHFADLFACDAEARRRAAEELQAPATTPNGGAG